MYKSLTFTPYLSDLCDTSTIQDVFSPHKNQNISSAIATIQATHTDISCTHSFKVLLFFNSGGNPKHSLPQWLGAYCKVHMNTSLFLWYIAFIYILQELSQNSACPTPTIIVHQLGLYFYYSYLFVPMWPNKASANRHVVMESKFK